MIILILPTFMGLMPEYKVMEETENRAFKSLPVFDITKPDDFPKAFDDYYSDNFSFRNQLLKLNSKIKYHWFDLPPFAGKAFIGRQGWMYTIKDEMDHYLGKTVFSSDTLNRFIEIINYRKHILDSIGCKYYFAIVPIKTTVYPEYLPLSKSVDEQVTLTDQLISILGNDSNIRVIDLRDILIQQKGALNLFHKTDNHWNEYGAYFAYKAIMEAISNDFPGLESDELSDFKIETVEVPGKNLTQLMGIYEEVNELEVICKPSFITKAKKGEKHNYQVPEYFPFKNSYERVFVTDDSKKPKILVIHDSFGSALIPFLIEHFSKSVFIFDAWQHNLNESILFNEKPDIYIQLVSESLLPNIPKNAKKP